MTSEIQIGLCYGCDAFVEVLVLYLEKTINMLSPAIKYLPSYI